jgi:hypothetical protein
MYSTDRQNKLERKKKEKRKGIKNSGIWDERTTILKQRREQ